MEQKIDFDQIPNGGGEVDLEVNDLIIGNQYCKISFFFQIFKYKKPHRRGGDHPYYPP